MIHSLYEYNRDFLQNKKVIIYGILNSSQLLAMRLIQENIPFEGFLFPGEQTSLRNLINKHVYHREEIFESYDDIAILVPYLLKQEAIIYVKKNPELRVFMSYETIKQKVVNADNVIVYGCGERAELLEKNVPDLNIACYLNSDRNKEGDFFKGKVIHHPSSLKHLKGSLVIIIASTYYTDIHNILMKYGYNENEIYIDLMDIIINEYESSQIRIPHWAFMQFGKDLWQKKVILYGERKTTSKIVNIFKQINIEFSYVIGRDSISENGTIYDIFYQSNHKPDIVMMTDYPNIKQYEILKEMSYFDEQIMYIGAESLYYSYRKYLLYMGLDPVLGYGKFSENKNSLLFSKHTGNDKYSGTVEKRTIRIAVLGGSTTDENGVRNKSWPEYLCEYLQEQNISYELYNGGVEAFNASQELLKLVRDVTVLNPDIVISYSSVNNIFKKGPCEEKFPFINEQQKCLFDALKSRLDIFGKRAQFIEKGIEYKGEWHDFWLSQIRMQKAVCQEFGIKYLSILQPNFFTKKNFMERDQELLAWHNMYVEENELKFSNDIFGLMWLENSKFQKGISEKIKNINYIYDLRTVFDDIDDAYIDRAHLYSFANKIIAKNIYKILEKEHYLR